MTTPLCALCHTLNVANFSTLASFSFAARAAFSTPVSLSTSHRLSIFAPSLDLEEVQYHLDLLVRVSTGGKDAGPIGELSQSERFHWLVSPRSTIVQTSPMHSGLCADPEKTLQALLEKMVHVARP